MAEKKEAPEVKETTTKPTETKTQASVENKSATDSAASAKVDSAAKEGETEKKEEAVEETKSETAVVEESKADVAAVEETKSEESKADLVVAHVKRRYTLELGGGIKATYIPGHVTMPREHAEHWYSKCCQTEIIGVPDDGSVNGVGARSSVERMLADAKSLANQIKSFVDSHSELTEGQKGDLGEAFDAANEIHDLIGGL